MAGARSSAWARPPWCTRSAEAAVVPDQGHPDQVGGRLDGQQRHSAAPPWGQGRRPGPPTGRPRPSPSELTVTARCGVVVVGAGRQPDDEGSRPEDGLGHVPPLDQGHAAVLDQLGRGPGRRSRAGGRGGRRRHGAGPDRGPAGRSGRPTGYWRTRVKVGLVTGSATPRPAANPWAKVVLPAPRSPASSTTSPGTHRAARAPARARVWSAEVVRSPPGRHRSAGRRRGPRPVTSSIPAAAWPGSRSARISATTTPPERRAAAGW